MEGSNSPEFIGGPLYRLCCRRSCGQAFGSPVRRLVALVLVVWLPLLVLSALAGHAVGDRVRLPFLHDIEMQARLLVTLPLLMPALLVAAIFRILDSLRVFDVIYVLTSNSSSTMSMSVYARQHLVEFQDVGYGSAASTLLFLVVAVIAMLYLYLGRRQLEVRS